MPIRDGGMEKLLREFAFWAQTDSMHTLDFDVIIVGSGVAGLYAALNLDEALSCAILNKLGPDDSNSLYAQGGIASVTLSTDSFENHYQDTQIAGAHLCDHESVSVLVREGPENIKRLIELGVPFDRDHDNNLLVSTEGPMKTEYSTVVATTGFQTKTRLSI